jgi:hypothetical protein
VTIKNPEAPATDAQLNAIAKMAAKLGQTVPTEGLTKGEASECISQLAHTLDAQKTAAPAPAKPAVSLMALAAQLEGKPAVAKALKDGDLEPGHVEQAAKMALSPGRTMRITLEQAKTLLSWFPVLCAEVDPTEADAAMELALQLFVNPISDEQLTGKPAESKPANDVPAGHYAIGAEGETKFYRVQYGKPGTKWDGFCFVDVQASDDYYAVKGKGKFEVLDAITAQGIVESAKRYGHELGKCGMCLKTLTDPVSIANGIGPDCAKNLGL